MQPIAGTKLESRAVETEWAPKSERPLSILAPASHQLCHHEHVFTLASLGGDRAATTPTGGIAVSVKLNDTNRAALSAGHGAFPFLEAAPRFHGLGHVPGGQVPPSTVAGPSALSQEWTSLFCAVLFLQVNF